jgi:hypothetical protein
MSKFLALCFLAGLVFTPNITSSATALPLKAVPAKAVPVVPVAVNTTSGKRVEVYATTLKADLERQEAILMRYIKGLQSDRENRSARLKSLQFTLSDLKSKLLNATQNYNVYNKQVVAQEDAFRPLDISFKRASDMYEKDMKNLKEEKEFVDALLRYIKLKKC